MELLFHYMYINYHTDLAVLPLDQRVQQANSRTSASSCWCGRRRGGRDPRCWPAASTTSRCWAQPRGPAGSDAPSCVQGARFRVARGLLDPRLGVRVLRRAKLQADLRTKLQAPVIQPRCAYMPRWTRPERSFGAATRTEGGGRPVISAVPFGVGPGWSHGKIFRTGMIKGRAT